MKKSGKGRIGKYIIALLLVLIGTWLIRHAGGQVYGYFIGVVFFIMAITSIVDHEYVVKFGST
ncbi:MAG TPA: hypothetical protein VK172_02795 [Lentimicrobium sp.]|jgi:hypothetical protein|nr:hypothetical protein [Lentimicrobium sp.]